MCNLRYQNYFLCEMKQYINHTLFISLIFCRILRKGKVGSYHDELSDNQIKKLNDWTEKATKNTDFRFKE